MSLSPVSPLSSEFGEVEYELQLQLNAPRLQLTECTELGSPHLASQFSSYVRQFATPNIVTVFVPTSTLQQSVSDIASKGIRVDPKRGFRFRVGTFEVDRSKESIEVVKLLVALGRPLNFESVKGGLLEGTFRRDSPSVTALKRGYQSLCVSNSGDYIIFNSNQVKVCHLVRFRGGKCLDPLSEDDNLCEICRKRIATIWCVNDNAKLCKSCDQESHSGYSVFERHRRIPLSEAMGSMENCPIHSEIKVEYYCTKCRMPVCMRCKMTGSHAKGENASHPLIPIKDAYDRAVEAVSERNPQITKRARAIDEQLRRMDDQLQSIVANEKNVEEEIMRIARAAIEQAHLLAGEKALIVRSARTELMRKKDELNSVTKFISAQKSQGGVLSFIKAYDRHCGLVSAFKGTADIPSDTEMDGDMCVHGGLDVTSGDKRSPKKSAPRLSPEPVKPSKAKFDYEGEEEEIHEVKKTKPRSPPKKKALTVTVEYTKLTALAERKRQRNDEKGMVLDFQPFQGSKIIPASKAATLYLCFPFRALPQTYLLFSSERDGRSISKMHELIDDIGITTILVKSGTHVFGGFAAAKWVNNGQPFGEKSSSFIFSVTHDAFIPYRPRVADACHLFATADSLTFGKYDLKLADDFDTCSAVIENSYGIGFEQGGSDATRFLAGSPTFTADIVEVWGFFEIEP